jgi:hypothetical protein
MTESFEAQYARWVRGLAMEKFTKTWRIALVPTVHFTGDDDMHDYEERLLELEHVCNQFRTKLRNKSSAAGFEPIQDVFALDAVAGVYMFSSNSGFWSRKVENA